MRSHYPDLREVSINTMVPEMIPEEALLHIMSGLAEDGFAIVPHALPGHFCSLVRKEISELECDGKILPAKIGKGEFHHLNAEIRKDGTHWFNPEELTPVQAQVWGLLTTLRLKLNASLFLGLWDLEGHYAVYEPGAFYKTHLDRFQNDSKRTVSVVLFFNEGWTKKEGGALRLETKQGSVEVLPEAGTAVFFLSDRIPHEVLPTRRQRLSFAGWFKTRV